jgi:hypothetical protein
MSRSAKYVSSFSVTILAVLLVRMKSAPAQAVEVQTGPEIIYEEGHDTSPPLREIPPAPAPAGWRVMPLHRKAGPPFVTAENDSVLQVVPLPFVGTAGGAQLRWNARSGPCGSARC